ncbi:MAG: hypothetical protein ACXWZF_09225 [Actinomycetota bacterium]
MGSPPRSPARPVIRAAALAAVAAFALAACTGDDTPPASADETPTTSPPPVTSADSYVFTDAAGIEARLTLQGDGAILSVVNDTGALLPKPGIFVLDARDGTRSTWTVVGSGPVLEGERVEFTVERTAVPEARHLGLVVMLFGGEDYGAFVPPEPGGAA